MHWREIGGPAAVSQGKSGFGRILIENVTAQKLNATSNLSFTETGVTWTLDAAAADVLK
jgi:two-component sensor histidine kinase